ATLCEETEHESQLESNRGTNRPELTTVRIQPGLLSEDTEHES
ncbi:MAG: hypothetical protein ACI9K3_001059, partial [Halovenus sp.]